MKKLFSMILAALMLAGCLVISTSAAGADVEFSTKGSAGRPDDMVTYEVYVDKTAGSYSACVEVIYDQNAFKLMSCDNGTIWQKSQYSTSSLSSVKNGKGNFRYIAECNNPDEVNKATGLMFTLTFQILKTAVNGDNDITLSFPDDGNGWFFYAVDKNNKIDYVDLSVECTRQSVITVSGSDATAPVTEKQDNTDKPDDDTSKGDVTTKAPVIAYVTDDNGKLVKDEQGNYETYEVKDTSKPVPQIKFDENGEPETDAEGNYVTYYVTEPETDPDKAPSDNDSKKEDDSSEDDGSSDTLPGNRIGKKGAVLIVLIAAVVAAAVILIVAVAALKRKGDDVVSENGDAELPAGDEADTSEGEQSADDADGTDDGEENNDAE